MAKTCDHVSGTAWKEILLGKWKIFGEKGVGEAVKNERFWKETATEAAIEIGKDILIGTAVAAVIGTGGWAVVATAGISVLLNVGANAVAKNDKGFTENVSDLLIDINEKIEAGKETLKNNIFTKWFSGNAGFVTA